MTFEQRLNTVADGYRSRGFQVVLRPGPENLPPFAKDFKVEILAMSADGNALASVKASPLELEADPNLLRYSEVTAKQPRWRFDLFVVGSDDALPKRERPAGEPSEEDIRRALDEAERVLQAGFTAPSFAAAWAALEAAMRWRIRAASGEAGWGTLPQTLLNDLYWTGVIPTSVLRELERLVQARNAFVHGFATPPVDAGAVRFVVDTARRLLAQPQVVKQPA
jgi:hypothetical protein